jgi:hypothetical protein
MSKEDQRRERNRQAQRKHREFSCYFRSWLHFTSLANLIWDLQVSLSSSNWKSMIGCDKVFNTQEMTPTPQHIWQTYGPANKNFAHCHQPV